MAWLKGPGDVPPVRLRPSHVVGRDRSADLVIPDERVSKQHARFDWTGFQWLLRDLGSTNGTAIGGGPTLDRLAVPLDTGATIRFAGARNTWTLVDAGPPCASATDPDGNEVVGSASLLAIGPEETPAVLVTRGDFAWVLEDQSSGQVRAVTTRSTVEVGSVTWLLHLPGVHTLTRPAGPSISEVRLTFRVSRDEEHVELDAHLPSGVVSLGCHAYHYLLLELARRRLDCADPNDVEAGWVYQDDLLRSFRWRNERLNLAVFRAREKAEAAGIAEPERLIERRTDTRQIRIGIADLEVLRN